MHVTIRGTTLELLEGNIVEQATDAIVNAAHCRLNGGNGVDGWVHSRGGPTILAACEAIGYCPTGEAVITHGGELPAAHVIHAVGPVYNYDAKPASLLASAYRASLRRAVEAGLRSIAFPSLSTGAFAYPLREAAPIALGTIVEFLTQEEHGLELVRIVLYPRERADALSIFSGALRQIQTHDLPSSGESRRKES